MKEELAVGIAAHVAPQKLGDTFGEAIAKRGEAGDGAGVREEPLSVPERVRIFRAHRSYRGAANVADRHIGSDTPQRVTEGDRRAVVDRPTLQEELTALVKPDAPPERVPRRALGEELGLDVGDTSAQIGAVGDECEETCHRNLQVRPSSIETSEPHGTFHQKDVAGGIPASTQRAGGEPSADVSSLATRSAARASIRRARARALRSRAAR